jgi:CrcB protein
LVSKWQGYLPWGILSANTVASFIAGFASANLVTNETLLLLTVVGFAGGLSTFSSWAAATVQMAARRKIFAPTVYTLLTLILSSTAAYLGLLLG